MKDTVLMLDITVLILEMINIAEEVITVNVGIFPNPLIAALLIVIINPLTLVICIEEEGIFPQPLNGCYQSLRPYQ